MVDRDRSSLFYVARALHALQQQWGTIPHIKGKGDAAAAGEGDSFLHSGTTPTLWSSPLQ